MPDAELFNQPENTNPTMTKRISFGASGVITENMTLTNFIAWILSKFTNAWHTVGAVDTTLINGWVQGTEPMQFRLNGWGELEIRGILNATNATNPLAFTLPAGFRPTKVVYKQITIAQLGSTDGTIYIDTNGDVSITTGGTNCFVNETIVL
jgi:hypothetical protein